MRATATPEQIEQFLLGKDDTMTTKNSEPRDHTVVPVAGTEPVADLITGCHLALLRPFADMVTGGSLLRSFHSNGLVHQFRVEARGAVRYGLSYSGIKPVRLAVPPLREQALIAPSTVPTGATGAMLNPHSGKWRCCTYAGPD